jgi:Protein kinase domain
MSSAAPLVSGDPRQLGPYTILSRIGGGGMGMVYLGQTPDRRLVAVKVIRADRASDRELAARFRREVQAASGVAGFCTARVLDADLDAERPYYVTEYVAGPTVQEAVDEAGPMAGRQLEALAVGVAEALEAIHAAGVVHRDLKPSNVLLSPAGPKVIDFGIARPVDATTLTQTGKLIGSVNWLSPEQLQNGRASEASDIFAWGGLVAFAATGQPPFGRAPVGTIAHRILHEQPDVRGIGGGLREAVLAAMNKDPRRRPSARGLLERLVGGAERDPVSAATQVVQRTWTMPRVAATTAVPLAEPAITPVTMARPAARDETPRLAPQAAAVAAPWPERDAGREPARDGRDHVAERERAAPRTYQRGTVLADLLPGGLVRDLALVAAFAVVIYASLGDAPVSSVRITTPALMAMVGAALLGRTRSMGGLALGVIGFHAFGQGPLPSLRTVLGYLVLLVTMGLVGTLAALGRRHKTVGAIVAVAVGLTLMQAFLAGVGWDTFHLPRPRDLNPLNLF